MDQTLQIKPICATLIWRDSGPLKTKAFCKECGEEMPSWFDIRKHFSLSPEEYDDALTRWMAWIDEDWNGREIQL